MAGSASAVLYQSRIDRSYIDRSRIDAHNSSVDAVLAEAGYCGMTHLPTGRVCVRPARHRGSCDFWDRERAVEVLGRSSR